MKFGGIAVRTLLDPMYYARTGFLSIDIRPDWSRVVAKEELQDLSEVDPRSRSEL